MTKFLERVNQGIWGVPLLALILGCGLYYTVRTKGVQLRLLVPALKQFFGSIKQPEPGQGSSSFRALCTALGATVGTGNLAGVAGAITIGGPGAMFWIWVSGFLGMVTKFCEALLAVRFRKKTKDGEYLGGPMYVIQTGMGKGYSWLAKLYCVFGLAAAFGVGNAVQINTVASGLEEALQASGRALPPKWSLLIGVCAAVLIALLFWKNQSGIGAAAELLIPLATVVYLALGGFVLASNWRQILPALKAMVTGAFSPRAVTGGMVGSAFEALRIGVSRGVFTNEAGMGTAGIAHGTANVRHPAEQGMMGIVEVFLDTIVICTITALVILVSGIYIPYGGDSGIGLTIQAFSAVCGGWVGYLICALLCIFAFATILGWGLYGGRCAMFLFGEGSWRPFVIGEILVAALAGAISAEPLWLLSEILNGLMAVPNLISLFALSPEVLKIAEAYKELGK